MRGDTAPRRIAEAMGYAAYWDCAHPWHEMAAVRQQWWVDYSVAREKADRKLKAASPTEPGEQGTLL